MNLQFVAVDTETTGLDVFDPKVQMICTSLWNQKGQGRVIRHDFEQPHAGLAKLLTDPTKIKLFWNAKFDIRMLRKSGYRVKQPWFDVAMGARIAVTNMDKYDLKSWTRHFLNDPYIEEVKLRQFLRKHKIKKSVEGLRRVPDRILFPYALKDAQRTLELWFMIADALKKKGLWEVFEVECEVLTRSMRMESWGMDLEPETVKRQHAQVEKEAAERLAVIRKLAKNPSFNPQSSPQVAQLVYGAGACMPTRYSKKTGNVSCNEVALLEAATPEAIAVLGYRKLYTALKTYYRKFAAFLKEGRGVTLHPSLNSMGALTGRFSSSRPNLQNLPRPKEHPRWGGALAGIRKCFIPRPGFVFLFADYEQIEMRLTAHFTGERHMLRAILEGRDLHDETAKRIFRITKDNPQWERYRYLGKTLNFSVIYGVQEDTFAQTILKQSGIPISWYEAHQYLEAYRAEHPALMKFFEDVEMEVEKTGGIRNHYGRFITVSRRKTYPGVNYHIQSTAADVMKRALIRCDDFLRDHKARSRLVMTVHDELIFEIHRSEQHLVRPLVALIPVMDEFKVPLTCSVKWGTSWGDQRKLVLAA